MTWDPTRSRITVKSQYPIFRASLDGVTADGAIVEIKCEAANFHHRAPGGGPYSLSLYLFFFYQAARGYSAVSQRGSRHARVTSPRVASYKLLFRSIHWTLSQAGVSTTRLRRTTPGPLSHIIYKVGTNNSPDMFGYFATGCKHKSGGH